MELDNVSEIVNVATSPNKTGTLFLVSTPIGNLEDISFRAIRILKEADVVAAEDTRHTAILFRRYEISSKLESYHAYSQNKKTPFLIQRLLHGDSVALVTDSGTPGISDPAHRLVVESVKQGIPIVPVPGPSAAIAALVCSGLPTDRFVFEGFLPVKKGRRKKLEQLSLEPRTVVLYESPHRLIRTLVELLEFFGDRSVAVCREMTKKFESFDRGPLSKMVGHFTNRKIQGEFVLVVEGKRKRHAQMDR